GEGFAVDEWEFTDEVSGRLARACYERRVERIRIEATPEAHDLAALYEVLTSPPERLFASGGADGVLRASGVSSIALRELDPMAISGAISGVGDSTPDEPLAEVDLAALRESRALSEEAAAELCGSSANLGDRLC